MSRTRRDDNIWPNGLLMRLVHYKRTRWTYSECTKCAPVGKCFGWNNYARHVYVVRMWCECSLSALTAAAAAARAGISLHVNRAKLTMFIRLTSVHQIGQRWRQRIMNLTFVASLHSFPPVQDSPNELGKVCSRPLRAAIWRILRLKNNPVMTAALKLITRPRCAT